MSDNKAVVDLRDTGDFYDPLTHELAMPTNPLEAVIALRRMLGLCLQVLTDPNVPHDVRQEIARQAAVMNLATYGFDPRFHIGTPS